MNRDPEISIGLKSKEIQSACVPVVCRMSSLVCLILQFSIRCKMPVWGVFFKTPNYVHFVTQSYTAIISVGVAVGDKNQRVVTLQILCELGD